MLKLAGEVGRILASGCGVRKVEDAFSIVVINGDFPMLGRRIGGMLTGLTAKDLHIGGHLVVVVSVAAVRFGRKFGMHVGWNRRPIPLFCAREST